MNVVLQSALEKCFSVFQHVIHQMKINIHCNRVDVFLEKWAKSTNTANIRDIHIVHLLNVFSVTSAFILSTLSVSSVMALCSFWMSNRMKYCVTVSLAWHYLSWTWRSSDKRWGNQPILKRRCVVRVTLLSGTKHVSCLTRVTVVGHEEFPILRVVPAELQLQHVRVVPDVAPLDVNGRLFVATTGRIPGRPVHLVQVSLCAGRTFSLHNCNRSHFQRKKKKERRRRGRRRKKSDVAFSVFVYFTRNIWGKKRRDVIWWFNICLYLMSSFITVCVCVCFGTGSIVGVHGRI